MKQEISREGLEASLRSHLAGRGLQSPKYAVVIPIVCGSDEPELLIEVRASGISLSGDPCFPGGKIEAGEKPQAAALRELREEMGIAASADHVLGQIPTVSTPLGQRTNIYVCTLAREDAACMLPNAAEVEKVLRVPISFFLSQPHAGSYSFGGSVIWGMTAGAIRHLCAAWRRAFPEA